MQEAVERNQGWRIGGLAAGIAALLFSALPQTAAAQAGSSGGMTLPGSGRTAIGLNVGTSTFNVSCGVRPGCDDTDRYVNVYGQSMFNDLWGARLGLVDMGRMDRGGGSTRARGLDLSLIGRYPFGDRFSVYGKLGTTYGHTTTSVAAGSGLTAGSENGFGLSYGAGLSWDFTPRLSAVLEFDSRDFRFAGSGRDPVRSTSLGLQWKY